MKFLELARLRSSIRSYKNLPVDRSVIQRCIEAARLAPSACNAQPWSFIVVDDPDVKNSLAARTLLAFSKMNRFVNQAPVIVVVVSERPNLSSRTGSLLKGKPLHLMDVGIAVQNLVLQAAEEGLGSCILGWFNERYARKLLAIPRNKRIPLMITLGYADGDNSRNKIRKDLDDIMKYNSY